MEFLSKSGLSFFKSLLDLYFATKSYVNKAISTNTGKFWGTYNSLADLQEITGSNGDYAYVIVTDDYSTSYDRYKWQDNQWVYEYTVGGEAFDDDQWAAINSGITSADKARLDEISENIGNNSISEMRSDIDANASEIEGINEELGDIDAALANKANVDGYYESMAVGQADNLKGQVLIPNDAAFRTSGGSEDVDTGLAHLQNVQGNTVSWNQLLDAKQTTSINGITYTFSNGMLRIKGTVTSNGGRTTPITNTRFPLVSGHVYVFIRPIINQFAWFIENANNVSEYEYASVIFTASKTFASAFIGANIPPIGTEVDVSGRFLLFDLTLIYGSGNEPTSVEQFEADYQKWFGKPLTYEPYNAGELIPAKTTALKTTGFNQWDEEWEVGTLGISNGKMVKVANNSVIRSKNLIPVFPNSKYSVTIPDNKAYVIGVKDEEGNGAVILARETNSFTTQAQTRFIAFSTYTSYPSTYNHDICINLSWSGTRNGEYKPYESHTIQLPITTLTGKLNGTGESVVVFPDGMKKAGSIQDEIYVSGGKTYAVKRVGSVDLGSLNWVKQNGRFEYNDNLDNFKLPSISSTPFTGTCGIYVIISASLANADKVCLYSTDNGYLRVFDKNKINDVTAEQFKAAMQGVMLYYELATPLVYELDDFALPRTFRVNDWGTEEQIHAEGVASVPATLANVYAMNAVDTINHLREEVTEIEGDITEMQSDIDAERVHADSLIFDVTKENSGATFASLSVLLSAPNLSTLIPTSVRTGGMTIRFVQTSDNKYIQARCMAQNFTTDVTQWQGVDDEPVAGSSNLVESGGVAKHEGVIDTITPIVFTKNRRYSTGGEQINIESDIVSTEAWRCAAVDCTEGDAFSISGQAGGDAAALCTFIASDGTVLKRDAILGLVKNHFSVAPANAAKCLINDIKTGQPCYKGRTIMALIQNLLDIMPTKADDDEVVKIVNQALTSDQKNQVLSNLGIVDFVNNTPSAINSLQAGLSTVQSGVDAIEKIVVQYPYVNDNTSGSSSKTVGPYEYSTNMPVGTLMEVCLSDVITNENANGYIQFQLFNGDTRILNKNFMTSDGTLVNGSTYITAEQQVSKIAVKGVSQAGTFIQLNVSVTTGELVKDRIAVQQLHNDVQECLKVYPELVTTANISSVLSDANNATDNTIYFILSRTAPSHFPDYYPAGNAPSVILETKTSGIIKIQSIRDLYTNDCLWERQYANSSWGEWVSVCHKISVNKSVTTNKWAYSSLYDALSFAKHHRNTEIVVEPGTYDLIQEMGSDITGQNLGILLNSGMKIYCKQNVFVTCHYTGDDDGVMENFSAFMTGEGDWEIDGLNLSCSKVRYCIHDDMGQSPYQYKHVLKNCKFYLDNTESTWRAKQCIGGGLGKNGTVIIENCIFESIGVDTSTHDDVNSEVSYHNSSVADAQSTVRLSECYFVNSSVSFGYYGASTKITVAIVNGCSCKWVPLVRRQSDGFNVENIELKQWNNEIRQ